MTTYNDYRRLSAALRESHCEIIEGVITDLQRLPTSGPQKSESFVVADSHFKYSDYIVTAGFNHMQSLGGPIRESMRVRIYHVRGEIARLDVAQPQ